jgi:quinol monooxygenase YgiN
VIIIAGWLKIKPEMRADAMQALVAMHDASSAEEGCVSYRFYLDIEDSNTAFLFEEWESEEALAAHGRTAHMAEYRAKVPTLFTGERQLTRYEATSKRPL